MRPRYLMCTDASTTASQAFVGCATAQCTADRVRKIALRAFTPVFDGLWRRCARCRASPRDFAHPAKFLTQGGRPSPVVAMNLHPTARCVAPDADLGGCGGGARCAGPPHDGRAVAVRIVDHHVIR